MNESKAQRVPELLAPAGDRERLEAAVRFGADAVYLGGERFGMRSSPVNFDGEGLKQAVEHCHSRGVRVYLTCNTLPHNRDLEELPEFFRTAAQAGVDALIVADLGVLLEAARTVPQLDLHVSTQAGVVNYLTARELHAMGAKRVVLARELSLEEIRSIRDRTPAGLEIEAFVHGAMCMAFSGRCLISNYLTGRDANGGECAQPCRWSYRLVEEKRPGEYFPIGEEEGGTYLLNAKDLCMLPWVDRLAEAGITSFKIEGRAKSAYYAAVITNAYRMALDLYRENPGDFQLPPWLLEETKKVRHRAYGTGFYFPEDPPGQYHESGGYVRTWDVAAWVEEWREGRLYCTQRSRFFVGDTVEVLEPGCKPFALEIEAMWNGEGEPVDAARHPVMELSVPCGRAVSPGSLLRVQREPEPLKR